MKGALFLDSIICPFFLFLRFRQNSALSNFHFFCRSWCLPGGILVYLMSCTSLEHATWQNRMKGALIIPRQYYFDAFFNFQSAFLIDVPRRWYTSTTHQPPPVVARCSFRSFKALVIQCKSIISKEYHLWFCHPFCSTCTYTCTDDSRMGIALEFTLGSAACRRVKVNDSIPFVYFLVRHGPDSHVDPYICPEACLLVFPRVWVTFLWQ
jgi:hypothetical protein